MQTGLTDRVALVVAASHGIGRAVAQSFAAEGCHLALCSRDPAALEQLAAVLREQAPVQVWTKPVNVRDTARLHAFVSEAHEHFGRIDICVANAGGPPAKPFLDTSDADWNAAYALNLRSVAALARAVVPYMRPRRWGRFVAITSLTVREPQPNLVLSNAVRVGVAGLVRSLATDFGPDGILFNNVAPGYTATERLLQVLDHRAATAGVPRLELERQLSSQIPLGRFGLPGEIADTIVWLASERASFITGQTILVDGGMCKGL